MTSKTKTGAEEIKWDLSDLYQSLDDPKINKDIKTSQKKAKLFQETYQGKIKNLSDKELLIAYQTLEDMILPLYKIQQFISLTFTTDTSCKKTKKSLAYINEVDSEIENKILFFDLEIGNLPKSKIKSLCQSEILKNYHYSIHSSHQTAKYNLSESEEKIINLKNLTGKSAFQQLYEELTSSFEFEFQKNGKKEKMNGSQLRALRQDKDPDIRKRAMKLFFSKYKQEELTLTHIYNNILKDHNIERKKRGYKTPLCPKRISQDLDEKIIKILHEVTTSSYPLVQRYYKIKKKILKQRDFTLSDIYAPIEKSDKKHTFNQAKKIVLDSFKSFDQEFYTYAKEMFDLKRIDAAISMKKRGGAFCSGYTPDTKPYVMLNFLGENRDVSTMAHELGHAIHDYLAAKQTLFNYHPILPLAETASVFCEMIVTDQLEKKCKNDKERISLLTDKLEDMFATSHRQNLFSRFEQRTHNTISEKIMSSDELCKVYREELKKMFGDSVKITDEYQWEWAAIPHIFESPFYVYAYNFGNLLVIALYQQYLKEGQSFIPKLKTILSAGSSKKPEEICKEAGININSKAFWQQAINYIESLIIQLEALI